ncbi:hypothetical protein OG912_32205 [Streptomyces sp. NBC_00464]|uniref:hypothetical protein n=1 Tax=Streptomyces sp. NBC_00464 TaxID=2975751 RepID=UPI002E19A80A
MTAGEMEIPSARDVVPSLQLDDIAHESEQTLVARGVAYAREYDQIQGKATTLVKNLAVVILALRRKHDDMRGTSHDYREAVAEMYRTANLPTDSNASLQSNVRYHVGNALRRHLTTRELEQLDLKTTSPLERFQDRRKTDSAIVRAVKAVDTAAASTPPPAKSAVKGKASASTAAAPVPAPVKATADHLRLVQVVTNVLGQISTDVVDRHMTAGQRARMDEELAEVQRRVTELRRHTRKPKSGA